MRTAIVIPARYGSSRFPGKPLIEILGMTMIERVWQLASAVGNIDGVLVATDDERIAEHVQSFGGEAVMTPKACRTGTDRCYAALQKMGAQPEIVLNFQGDAVLTPPWLVQLVVDEMRKNADVGIATPAVRMTAESYLNVMRERDDQVAGQTTVTFDRNSNALYFSKSMIPFLRQTEGVTQEQLPVFKHIGLYGYRYDALEQFLKMPPGVFEEAEQLEQLRALENGLPIRVVQVENLKTSLWSVDSPKDVKKVEDIIEKEGELLT